MGALAQGQRFATTLVLDRTLQKKFKEWEGPGTGARTVSGHLMSFGLSMTASGAGEALANPPVVLKNFQIAHSCTALEAGKRLVAEGGLCSFFRGVGPGVVRKSLA